MTIEHRLANAIRSQDTQSYQAIRYPKVPDGQLLIFSHEDFRGVNFTPFPLGSVIFRNCQLESATGLHGRLALIFCEARNLDLRDCSVIINATGSDFRGLRTNDGTYIGTRDPRRDSHSTFTDCQIDRLTEQLFSSQGAQFITSLE